MSLTPENTTVFIFAAGRGKRMMPLTATTPKPLLEIAGKSLIEYHLEHLAENGFKQIIINIDYLGEKIIQQLDDGQKWGLEILYSDERASGALETAGGIRQALPLIGSEQFLCINADVWTNFNVENLLQHCQSTPQMNASLMLVPNPEHNIEGDFGFDETNNHVVSKDELNDKQKSYTFSGIACYQKQAFADLPSGKQALKPLFQQWCEKKSISGLVFSGDWHDIGTPERFQKINQIVSID